MATLRLPIGGGEWLTHTTRPPHTWPSSDAPVESRVAYAAAHVVADPLADGDPVAAARLDWEATLAYRHHLWSHGLAVAEAMLARSVPVVTNAGALPEVVGDAGIVISAPEPAVIAAAVREALDRGPEDRERARRRVLEHFPYEARRDGICREVEAALRSSR